ncbi:bifunctional diguanylate cyclase/phosphodiesterase [Thiohalophilus sp.]|uniref:bifunctional diguanylate cyclase/phosphodiesterase n=1 Tax=Thiohalophilus sp. TaxID=3028392 RepID=UPI002ACF0938|nr:EAL domain-containing protein [Thiohalophilus sp.]MDZ7663545.1 EAL domain-containing protein [Thiohalophilus sp.]
MPLVPEASIINNLSHGWKTALDFLDEPICLLDLDDQVVQANKTFFAHLGRRSDEVIGKPISLFFHPEGEEVPCPVCRARYDRRDAVITLEADDPRNHAGRSIQVRIGVVRDAQGNPTGIVQHIQDLTLIRQAESKYLDTQRRFRSLFEASPDPQIIVDSDGIIEQANAQCFGVLGYKNTELIGESVEVLLPEHLRQRHVNFRQMFNSAPWARPMGNSELTCLRKDGSVIPVEVSLTSITTDQAVSICAVIRDISERKQAEQELQRLASFPELSPMPIIEITRQGELTYTNPAAKVTFSELGTLGIAHPALSNLQAMVNMVVGSERPVFRSIEVGGMVYEQQFSYVRENEVVRIYSWDITEIRDMADEMEYFATHDGLTGLINRSEFDRRINQLHDQSIRENQAHGMCYIDLDQFKIVNDKCGHSAGDELLRQLGRLLQETIRDTDTLARLGGDEFGLLLPGCGIEKAKEIAEAIRKVIAEYRFSWESHTFTVGASIGLVSINRHSGGVKEVMRAADTACYVAKDTGRDRVHVYHQDDYELGRHIKNIEWAHRLQQALSHGRFCLRKQLIRSTRTGKRDRYELLVSMKDEDGKLYAPGAFIPAAERFNLIKSIDKWVVNEAFSLIQAGHIDGNEISINLSGEALGDIDMVTYVINKLEEYQIDPKGLIFEITETAMVTNLANAKKFMSIMSDVGCHFALDDFGSGVSSFAYLQNLHVDYLKIDGSLVRNSVTNKINESMVKAIVDIGHAMGIATVAEFVEDETIYEKMLEVGIDYVQGYHIGHPEEVEK